MKILLKIIVFKKMESAVQIKQLNIFRRNYEIKENGNIR